MQALTIHEAAAATGWSARMLRYLDRVGLGAAPRSRGGYRVYGAAELQRLRTLRELLGEEPQLAEAISGWLLSTPTRPETIPSSDWLRYEQEKLRRLLAAAAA